MDLPDSPFSVTIALSVIRGKGEAFLWEDADERKEIRKRREKGRKQYGRVLSAPPIISTHFSPSVYLKERKKKSQGQKECAEKRKGRRERKKGGRGERGETRRRLQ